MAERPKISIKPSAPARDPHRPRVRGVTSPRPAPSAKTRSTERDVPPATPAAPAARPRPPAPRDEAPRRETRPPPRR
ncbi:MAG: hypothetical protein Q8M96_22695, partial [Rubrivivax sp.]|nr:hypothetical protein [Rubrivivax sp.]